MTNGINRGKAWLSFSDRSNSCVISESVSDACFVSSDSVFSWLFAWLVVVCWKLDIMYQIIRTEWKRPLMWGFQLSCFRSWAVFNTCCSCGFQRLQIPVASLIFVSSIDLVFPKYSSLESLSFAAFSYNPLLAYGSPVYVASVPGKQVLAASSLDLPVSPDFGVIVCPVISVLWWVQEKVLVFNLLGFFLF